MKFMTILLRESRKDDLIKKYQDKFSEESLSNIFSNPFIIKTSYKYADFLLKHLNPNYSFSELEEVIAGLEKFDKIQSRLEKTDINSYTGFFDLLTTVNEYTKKQEKPKSKKIYEDDKFIVIVPQNYVASCKYGAKTKWCTTMKDNDDYFNRYTSGNQGLYYVISKKDLDENLYKLALHFNNNNLLTIYDASDSSFSKREVAFFKSAYPDMWNAINNYHEKAHPDTTIQKVIEALNDRYNSHTSINVGDKTIRLVLQGYELMEQSGNLFLANNGLKIYDNTEIGSPILLDEYLVMVSCNLKSRDDMKGLDVDFTLEDFDEVPKLDLELSDFNRSGGIIIEHQNNLSLAISSIILNNVSRFLEHNNTLLRYVHKAPTWRPNRIHYGYTFGKNKGLIKKLVDWLDNSKVGTKLDFLVDIGKLEKRITDNNKSEYAISRSNQWRNSSDFRGHFASFFASAKNAGILNYRKIGSQFFLIKGPNFDAFKGGELKAL